MNFENILTPREIEVLRLCAQGCSNPQIAEKLIISPHTVKAHISNILYKLNVPSQLIAVIVAINAGII